jgi:hypothetical protein
MNISVSKVNFYREISKENGNDIIIKVPQYYSEKAVEVTYFYKTREDNQNMLTKCPELTEYSMEIPLSQAEIHEFAKIYTSIRRCKGLTGHKSPFKSSKLHLQGDDVTSAKFYNSDGTESKNGFLEMNCPCHVLLELYIPGFVVKNGVAVLDIRIRRCAFIQAEKKAKVKLSLPGDRPKIPPHFLAIFNQSKPEDRECCICKDVIESDLTMTRCFHFYHESCLEQYDGESCPICRAQL